MTAFEGIVEIFTRVSSGLRVKSTNNSTEIKFRVLEGFVNLDGNIIPKLDEVIVKNDNERTTIEGPTNTVVTLLRDVIEEELAFMDPEGDIPLGIELLLRFEDGSHKIGVFEGELIISENTRYSPYDIDGWYPINKLI